MFETWSPWAPELEPASTIPKSNESGEAWAIGPLTATARLAAFVESETASEELWAEASADAVSSRRSAGTERRDVTARQLIAVLRGWNLYRRAGTNPQWDATKEKKPQARRRLELFELQRYETEGTWKLVQQH